MNTDLEKHSVAKTASEAEERLHFALEATNNGMWDWHIDTGEVYFSPHWKDLFGFAPAENKIDEWLLRIHPDDRPQLDLDLQLHFNSGQSTYETTYRMRAKDGTYRWISASGKIVNRTEDGAPLRMIGVHKDITEKRESEEQYRNLFNITPLPTWIYDYETLQFLAVNQAAISHYGYTLDEFLNMSILDIRDTTQKELIRRLLPERELDEKTTYTNLKHIKRNGEEIVVELNSTTISYNGRKARLVVVNDITAKVATEAELKSSHQRLQYVTKATSDAVYDLEFATGQLEWGEGLTSLFGYTSSEVTLKQWVAFIHPDEQAVVNNILNETIYNSRKKLWKMEYRFLKKDGNYRYVIDKGFILRDAANTPLRMIGAMQDITNFKQQQLALAESNKRFEYATLAISDIIWDWVFEKDAVLWSDNYERLMGWQLPDDKWVSFDVCLERVHEGDRQRVMNSINGALQKKEATFWDAELRYLKVNGEVAYIYNRAHILRDETGTAVRMIGAMQDMTHRKKLEEQLLQEELDKQKVISKATIDTQERERSEIGKELHDNVNQVLTTTKLYLELALSRADLKDELLQKSQANISYVINEIRQLSRSLMNPSLGDLGLVDSIHDLIENVQATRKLQVLFQATPDVAIGFTDNLELTIYRIIQEALNNAVKHAQASRVIISLQKIEHRVELVIEDNGIGFYLEGTKNGSGLKNIKNRVYLSDGTLEIESQPGAGCTIRIFFNI